MILKLSLDSLSGVTACDGQLKVIVLSMMPAELSWPLNDQMHYGLSSWRSTWVC